MTTDLTTYSQHQAQLCALHRALMRMVQTSNDCAVTGVDCNSRGGASLCSCSLEVQAEIEDERVEAECRSQANLLNRAADEIASLRRQLSAAQDSHAGQQRNTIAFARENEELTARITTLNTHVAALRSLLEAIRDDGTFNHRPITAGRVRDVLEGTRDD